MHPVSHPDPGRSRLDVLRAELARARTSGAQALPFGVGALDDRLAERGLAGDGLHELAAASETLNDDAATTLFAAGIAARFAASSGQSVLWALTRFDLYAPGLEQAGLGPDKVFYAQARRDAEVLALTEDGLRDGSLACVIAEVKSADQTASRRLQLAASDGKTPMLLYRRHRARGTCPLLVPSAAMTRWRIGCAASEPLAYPGIGRARWSVELVRQRSGNPFSCLLEACDDTGRLALPAAIADRTAAPGRAAPRAA